MITSVEFSACIYTSVSDLDLFFRITEKTWKLCFPIFNVGQLNICCCFALFCYSGWNVSWIVNQNFASGTVVANYFISPRYDTSRLTGWKTGSIYLSTFVSFDLLFLNILFPWLFFFLFSVPMYAVWKTKMPPKCTSVLLRCITLHIMRVRC